MAENPLRVGIIGVGIAAVTWRIPGLLRTGRAEIAAICRRSPDKLAIAQEHLGVEKAYTDWRELLEQADLDAVYVGTPHDRHVGPTVAALQRGLHVLVDKPMALTSVDAWSMVEAARQAGRVLTVTYNMRLNGTWRSVKRALTDGRIGAVRQVHMTFAADRRFYWQDKIFPKVVRNYYQNTSGMPEAFFDWNLEGDWRVDPDRRGGGVCADPGTHNVDLALWFGDAPPVEVAALSAPSGEPIERFMNVQARLANDVLLSVVSADVAPGGVTGQKALAVVGEEAILAVDLDGSLKIQRNGQLEELDDRVPTADLHQAYVECVLDGTPNPVPGEQAAHTVALSEAAYRSAREGCIVHVDLPEAAEDDTV
jgi:predicted dehydrogenase